MTDQLLTLQQAARRIGHSTDAVRRAIRRGALVAYKPCGELRIPEAELEAFLEASRVTPTPAARTTPPARARSTSGPGAGSFRARAKG